jgi:hypothetical protein
MVHSLKIIDVKGKQENQWQTAKNSKKKPPGFGGFRETGWAFSAALNSLNRLQA